MIDRFDEAAENFDFLKVMLTQQTGHLEFGSFEFEYGRPSTRFEDLRPKLTPLAEYHDHDHGHEADHHRPSVTELTRFFKLFPHKRSALDIFSLLESSRVEARVMHEYPGLAKLYERQRQRVLALRPEIIFLPAREALIEFMIRLSLGATEIKIPTNCRTMGRDLRRLDRGDRRRDRRGNRRQERLLAAQVHEGDPDRVAQRPVGRAPEHQPPLSIRAVRPTWC